MDGVWYDLAGVLYEPQGPGPFPAVILSHGSEGSGAFLASLLAPTMVGWGLVCIAPNYTVASQTGGGARPSYIVAGPAPSPSQGEGRDQRFDSLLAARNVEHAVYLYAGKPTSRSARTPPCWPG